MAFLIGLYSPDKRPLARTVGFKSEIVCIKDGDNDMLNIPKPESVELMREHSDAEAS